MNDFEDQNKIKCEQTPSVAASKPGRERCLGCVAWAPGDPFTHPAWPLHALLPPPESPFPDTTYVKMLMWPLGLCSEPCPFSDASLPSTPGWVRTLGGPSVPVVALTSIFKMLSESASPTRLTLH